MHLPDRGASPRTTRLAWMMGLVVLIGAAMLWAQQGSAQDNASTGNATQAAPNTTAPTGGAGGAADDPTGRLPTVLELFYISPVINGIIVALSAIALLLFIFFLVSITSSSMAPPTLVDDLTKLVINQQYREAADLCRARHNIFISSIIQRCVENADKEHSVILDMLESEGKRRADILWNRLSYLADISNVAPMLGLFGTVYGMMKAFYAAQFQSLSASSAALTQGISQAMATTMFGLIVAILAVFFYSIVKARATRALAEVEHAVHTIADHMKRGSA